jgi:vacuolar-type H+-ATPase subunit I/STV1
MATVAPSQDDGTEAMRIRYAFWLAVFGLGLAALLVVFLVQAGWKTASDVAAVVGLFTSVLGTLVGAFFGVQIGSAGKEKEQRAAQAANRLAQRALAALAPEQAQAVLQEPA